MLALEAASKLREYTLSDRGIFLTMKAANESVTDNLRVYKAGGDEDPADPLLNSAAVLLGGHVCEEDAELAQSFVDWMIRADGGQAVVAEFKKDGTDEVLYTPAPGDGVDW